MQTVAGSALVFCALLCLPAASAAQPRAGALAVDERQGDQYGWAVDWGCPDPVDGLTLGGSHHDTPWFSVLINRR